MARMLCSTDVTPVSLVLACGLVNCADEAGIDTVVITAGRNGKHMPGSRHYDDAALDIRIHNLTSSERNLLMSKLKSKFPPPRYDVILESVNTPNEHIHLEENKPQVETKYV